MGQLKRVFIIIVQKFFCVNSSKYLTKREKEKYGGKDYRE